MYNDSARQELMGPAWNEKICHGLLCGAFLDTMLAIENLPGPEPLNSLLFLKILYKYVMWV